MNPTFPRLLAKHCCEQTYKQLDFFLLKYDAWEEIFCKNHIMPELTQLFFPIEEGMTVPVCTVCSISIPIKKREMPDVAVGTHKDTGCKLDSILYDQCDQPNFSFVIVIFRVQLEHFDGKIAAFCSPLAFKYAGPMITVTSSDSAGSSAL
uniref:ZFAND2A/B-like C2H2 zinc finger domain-containing protein n=1 Tax=Pseudonaja textilis TaxID=8673 RepID=A0A670YED7_PSETE